MRERFTERYVIPIEAAGSEKHGFCTMAICCLMVEALESFKNGWASSKGKSKKAFEKFFQRVPELKVFSDAIDFWESVRCGILHLGETKGVWRVRRNGPLFDPETKTINATEFHKLMKSVLKRDCDELQDAAWESEVWNNFRKRMRAVCGPTEGDQNLEDGDSMP